jgi:hypothetical protein
MDDSVVGFAKSVEAAKCRIFNTPRLVFLCGGPTKQDPAPYVSARDYFHRYLLKNHPDIVKRAKLAETIIDWFDENTYTDVFVESPGSYAELGAFAASRSLCPKTLAVTNSRHPTSRTFISDGPIRRMQKTNAEPVLGYDWSPSDLNQDTTLAIFENMSTDLVERLQQIDRTNSQEQPLDLSSPGHAVLAVADVIDLAGILTVGEVEDYLERVPPFPPYGADR